MKPFYLVKDQDQLAQYQTFYQTNKEKLKAYQSFLVDIYKVKEWPEFLLLADEVSATQLIRTIPVPAYTNDI